jgi:hypothetical protein
MGVSIYDAGTHSDVNTGVPLSYGVFHNIAMTIQGGGLADLYLDGSLVFSNSYGVPGTLPNENAFLFGYGENLFSYPMYGELDDIRIYDSVLSGGDIAALAHINSTPEPRGKPAARRRFGVLDCGRQS